MTAAWRGVGRIIWAMLVIVALQENQGQPIKASHIVTDVYIKKAIKKLQSSTMAKDRNRSGNTVQ
jgi:hypothetical protein